MDLAFVVTECRLVVPDPPLELEAVEVDRAGRLPAALLDPDRAECGLPVTGEPAGAGHPGAAVSVNMMVKIILNRPIIASVDSRGEGWGEPTLLRGYAHARPGRNPFSRARQPLSPVFSFDLLTLGPGAAKVHFNLISQVNQIGPGG